MKSLLARLLDAGYPKAQVYHHSSDLYVFATPLTKRVIEGWAKETGLRPPYTDNSFCSRFKDQVTGRPMYDIAFQYDPALM